MGLMRRVPLPVDLDFPPARRPVGWLGAVLLAAGVTATVLAVVDYRAEQFDLSEREATVARLRQQLQRTSHKPAESGRAAVGADEAKAALDVAARLNADWGGMFAGIAAAQSDAATWVRFDGDAPRGSLRIVGEARSLPAVFDFLARLDAADGVADAQLSSYEWTRAGPVDVVRFTANAKWSAGR